MVRLNPWSDEECTAKPRRDLLRRWASWRCRQWSPWWMADERKGGVMFRVGEDEKQVEPR